MIRITVLDRGDDGISVVITGHAGAAERGRDIVCAAVSAIIHTAILGLEEVARQYPDRILCELDGVDVLMEPTSQERTLRVVQNEPVIEARAPGTRLHPL